MALTKHQEENPIISGQPLVSLQTQTSFVCLLWNLESLFDLKLVKPAEEGLEFERNVKFVSKCRFNIKNCCSRAVLCLWIVYRRVMTGIMFCYETDGPITGWAYK